MRLSKSHVFEVFSWVCVGVNADGGPANRSDGGSMCYPNMPICLPCWPGCKSCQDGTPCWVQEAWLLRAGVLAVQGVFMFLIFVSMLVAYRHRRNRVSQVFWLNRAIVQMGLDRGRAFLGTEPWCIVSQNSAVFLVYSRSPQICLSIFMLLSAYMCKSVLLPSINL